MADGYIQQQKIYSVHASAIGVAWTRTHFVYAI